MGVKTPTRASYTATAHVCATVVATVIVTVIVTVIYVVKSVDGLTATASGALGTGRMAVASVLKAARRVIACERTVAKAAHGAFVCQFFTGDVTLQVVCRLTCARAGHVKALAIPTD